MYNVGCVYVCECVLYSIYEDASIVILIRTHASVAESSSVETITTLFWMDKINMELSLCLVWIFPQRYLQKRVLIVHWLVVVQFLSVIHRNFYHEEATG